MNERKTPTLISCIVDIPADRLEEAAKLLGNMGISLDPKQQTIAFNDAMMAESVAMGHHLPGMVEGINRSLDEAGLRPRILEDHEEWSAERRQAFLQFAIDNCNWNDDTLKDTSWADEGMTWQQLTQDHPLVFGEET